MHRWQGAFDCEGREGERRDDKSSSARALKIALPVLALSCAYSLGRAASSVRDGRAVSAERLDRVVLVAANATDVVLARDDAHPPILYGHIHMAKTGGTSLNGILANKFERVCGNKGYSYDAYADNERVKKKKEAGEKVRPKGRGKVKGHIMEETGFEDCDYVSRETRWPLEHWTQTFGEKRFHGMAMELHVPCRRPIDHLMSQCNYRHRDLECDAETDEEFHRAIDKCVTFPTRFSKDLLNHFTVKCFDYEQQFTTYIDYMAERLQRRRFESVPYVKRETNRPRNKTRECIWNDERSYAKAEAYLISKYDYYSFCNRCMGSASEVTRNTLGRARTMLDLPTPAVSSNVTTAEIVHPRDAHAVSSNVTTAETVHPRDAHPPILYGHIHMAKTGGTSLNGILANKFERVCGNNGYSYDAYEDNERAKKKKAAGETVRPEGRSSVERSVMEETGFEDCDYVSRETQWPYWTQAFGGKRFHGVEMELHLPCRSPIDHLMSQCNYRHRSLECDAETDEEFHRAIDKCVVIPTRFSKDLLNHFTVKCFDYEEQFTTYIDYMAERLQRRRLESVPYVKRETNRPRNKTRECIWTDDTAYAKAEAHLKETYDYYSFCDECLGTEDEITRNT